MHTAGLSAVAAAVQDDGVAALAEQVEQAMVLQDAINKEADQGSGKQRRTQKKRKPPKKRINAEELD